MPPANHYERLYETHIGRLIATARDFGIEEIPAIELAHDVMMTFLHASTRVSNVSGWLNGAISYASEAYVLRGVFIDWARESAAPPDLTLPNGARWRDVAGRLTPRFQRVLELRYVEGRTVAEIAATLGSTQRYVETLLDLPPTDRKILIPAGGALRDRAEYERGKRKTKVWPRPAL